MLVRREPRRERRSLGCGDDEVAFGGLTTVSSHEGVAAKVAPLVQGRVDVLGCNASGHTGATVSGGVVVCRGLANSCGGCFHPYRVANEVLDDLAIGLTAPGASSGIVGMRRHEVGGLARHGVGRPEVLPAAAAGWIRNPRKSSENLNQWVVGTELASSVVHDQITRKDDFLAIPGRVGAHQDSEAQVTSTWTGLPPRSPSRTGRRGSPGPMRAPTTTPTSKSSSTPSANGNAAACPSTRPPRPSQLVFRQLLSRRDRLA